MAAYEGYVGCSGHGRAYVSCFKGGGGGGGQRETFAAARAVLCREPTGCLLACALQTGSGKTHSIVGPRMGHHMSGGTEEISTLDDADGLLNRAFRYAFDTIAASQDSEYETAVTCAELYNDQVL